jgi:hypothetical protein
MFEINIQPNPFIGSAASANCISQSECGLSWYVLWLLLVSQNDLLTTDCSHLEMEIEYSWFLGYAKPP